MWLRLLRFHFEPSDPSDCLQLDPGFNEEINCALSWKHDRSGTALLESLPHLLRLPSKQVWFDFDEEADVLYVSFERPQGATDSELSEEGVLMRYRGDQLVGVTILNARKRLRSHA